MYFSIYEGEDRNEIVEAEWIKKVKSVQTLNDMQNIILEEIEIEEISCKDIPGPDEVNDAFSHGHDVIDENQGDESLIDDMECDSGSCQSTTSL